MHDKTTMFGVMAIELNATITIFQPYCGAPFYWWWKPEYPDRDRHCHDCMEVGFTTTYANNAYHH
jgi:hypothetical protein